MLFYTLGPLKSERFCKSNNYAPGSYLINLLLQKRVCYLIPDNFQISKRGTNEDKCLKKRDIPKFLMHYYTHFFFFAKKGTHD